MGGAGVNYWAHFQRDAKLTDQCELSAIVNPDRPEAGIQADQAILFSTPLRVLSIAAGPATHDWPARLVDQYARGNDLVATYAGSDAWPFAPQIYWTSEAVETSSAVIDALSVMVSIQTDRLDTHPRVVVRSVVPADEVLLVSVAGDELLVDSHAIGKLRVDPNATACGIIFRLRGSEVSYTELMPTSDFGELTVARADVLAVESRWELFNEFLEKGVIRRVRMQAAFVPRAADVQVVAELCQSLAERPLPLTT